MSSIFFIIHQCPRKWETLFNKMIRNYFVNFCFYYNLIKNVLNLIFTASVLRIPRIQQFQVHQTFGNKCALSQAQIVYGGTHVSRLVMPNSLRPQGVQPARQVPLSMEFYREEQKSLVYLETQRIRTFFFLISVIQELFGSFQWLVSSFSPVHGTLQARILEQIAIPFSRESSLTQGSNLGLLHCRRILYHLRHQGSPTVGQPELN